MINKILSTGLTLQPSKGYNISTKGQTDKRFSPMGGLAKHRGENMKINDIPIIKVNISVKIIFLRSKKNSFHFII